MWHALDVNHCHVTYTWCKPLSCDPLLQLQREGEPLSGGHRLQDQEADRRRKDILSEPSLPSWGKNHMICMWPIVSFQLSIKYPTFGGQVYDQEPSCVANFSSWEKQLLLYHLLPLIVKTHCSTSCLSSTCSCNECRPQLLFSKSSANIYCDFPRLS